MPYKDKEKIKEYNRKYHLRTWEKRKLRHKELKRKRRNELAKWLRDLKKDLSCSKCNENHPACIDFHHIDSNEKEGNISNMIGTGYSTQSVRREISKCIVLCRNCQAKEHYRVRNLRV